MSEREQHERRIVDTWRRHMLRGYSNLSRQKVLEHFPEQEVFCVPPSTNWLDITTQSGAIGCPAVKRCHGYLSKETATA